MRQEIPEKYLRLWQPCSLNLTHLRPVLQTLLTSSASRPGPPSPSCPLPTITTSHHRGLALYEEGSSSLQQELRFCNPCHPCALPRLQLPGEVQEEPGGEHQSTALHAKAEHDVRNQKNCAMSRLFTPQASHASPSPPACHSHPSIHCLLAAAEHEAERVCRQTPSAWLVAWPDPHLFLESP
jgi:hypothetical protein